VTELMAEMQLVVTQTVNSTAFTAVNLRVTTGLRSGHGLNNSYRRKI